MVDLTELLKYSFKGSFASFLGLILRIGGNVYLLLFIFHILPV